MAQTVGRNVASPLLFLNLIMYIMVIGFASWSLNHFINGQTNHPGSLHLSINSFDLSLSKLVSYTIDHRNLTVLVSGVAGNGATFYFLLFAILAGVLGVASKLAGANHIRAWRNDSLAAAATVALVAWAVTALAFGLACKEIKVGGHRGWRLRVLEALIIILTFTQLMYLLLLHAGIFSSKYGPGYRDTAPRGGAGDPPAAKSGLTASRV